MYSGVTNTMIAALESIPSASCVAVSCALTLLRTPAPPSTALCCASCSSSSQHVKPAFCSAVHTRVTLLWFSNSGGVPHACARKTSQMGPVLCEFSSSDW